MHAAQSASTQITHQQMQGRLVGIIKDIEPIQVQLLALYAEKSKALKEVDVKKIDQLAAAEEELTRELQFVLLRREQLLQIAQQQGLPSGSLQELLRGMGVSESAEIFEHINKAHERSQKLRHESWVQWIVSQRSYQHYSHILELIAHAGQKVPTYSRGQNEGGTGGAIFDASA